MKHYFKGIFNLRTSLFVLLAGFFAAGCTEVDDTLGLGFVPKDQQMLLRIKTLTGIDTYAVAASDSIPSSQMGLWLLGNRTATGFGQETCGAVGQYSVGIPFNNDKNHFGYKPVADSIVLSLYVSSTKGNYEAEQTFAIYAIKDNAVLRYDSTYYPTYPVDEVIDRNDPLFTFTLSGPLANESVSKKLTPTASGEALLARLVEADSLFYAAADTAFHDTFRGFYIAPTSDSPEDAAIYNIALSTSDYDYSYFTLYAHNHKEGMEHADSETAENIQDTISVMYYFDDADVWAAQTNTSINVIRHKYLPEIPTVTDTVNTASVVYIQGLGGVYAGLRFTDEFLAELDQLTTDTDPQTGETEQYSKVVINQAKIYLTLKESQNPDAMDAALNRLGMYTSYKTAYPTAIDDYLYYSESYYGSTIYYGGYIDRSNGCYVMDISSYITQLMYKRDKTPKLIWLAPSWNTTYYTPLLSQGEVALMGTGSSHPVQMKITYTLIK